MSEDEVNAVEAYGARGDGGGGEHARRFRTLFPLLTGVVLALAACSDAGPNDRDSGAQGDNFGPMAIIRMEPPAIRYQALGGTGPVEIGDTCVTLTRANGDKLLLVWRETDVLWDEGSRTITFAARPDEPLVIADGDEVTVGGRALIHEDGSPVEVEWIVTPNAGCTGTPWDVSSTSASPPAGLLE